MTLRKPCGHDRYEAHKVLINDGEWEICPGGKFLPVDALVIEQVNGEWPLGTKQFELTDDRGLVRRYLGVDLEFFALLNGGPM